MRYSSPPRHNAVIADTTVLTDALPTRVQDTRPAADEMPVVPYFSVEEQDMDDRYLTPAEAALVQIIEKTGDLPRAKTPVELLRVLDTTHAKQ